MAASEPQVRVTIVLAAYNAERWLERTLDSVVAQTMTDWRCHVVDDGSTDGTLAIGERHAARDPRFRLIRQANAGVSVARNRVLAETVDDGPYVSILDSDDLWLPDALEVMTAALDADPSAVGVQSLAEYVDEEDRPIRAAQHPAIQRRKAVVRGGRVVDAPYGTGVGFEEIVVGSGLYPPASMLLRRSAIEAAGRYDPTYRSQEDWELYTRMTRIGRFVELDRQTAWYRVRTENLTGDRTKVAVHQARLRRKAWEQTPSDDARRRVLVVANRHRQVGAARHHAIQARKAMVARRPGELLANTGLTAWFGVHALVGRPVSPVLPLTRAVSRLQSKLWAAEHSRTPAP